MAVITPTKRCSRCSREKDFDEFAIRARSADGRAVWCKPCHGEYIKGWRVQNGDKHRAQMRAWHYKTKYGLTPGQYADFVSGGCEVCGSQENMAIDHDHGTGDVRGALCSNCNRALGYAGDDAERLRGLADYLDSHRRD